MNNKSIVPSLEPLVLSFEDVNLTCPVENGHRMVPVRTVCQIIGVDFTRQDGWLKSHPIYGQLYNPMPTVGADNKARTMNCLSFFDLFGWLNSITQKGRKEGSYEKQLAFMAWLRERHMEIYKAIDVYRQENQYELELMEKKQGLLDEMDEAQENLRALRSDLKKLNQSIEEVRSKRYTGQTALPFPSDN